MCVPIFSPKDPAPQPETRAPEPQPIPVEKAERDTRERDRRRARLTSGRQSTILTSGLGLNSRPQTAKKQLLGQ